MISCLYVSQNQKQKTLRILKIQQSFAGFSSLDSELQLVWITRLPNKHTDADSDRGHGEVAQLCALELSCPTEVSLSGWWVPSETRGTCYKTAPKQWDFMVTTRNVWTFGEKWRKAPLLWSLEAGQAFLMEAVCSLLLENTDGLSDKRQARWSHEVLQSQSSDLSISLSRSQEEDGVRKYRATHSCYKNLSLMLKASALYEDLRVCTLINMS